MIHIHPYIENQESSQNYIDKLLNNQSELYSPIGKLHVAESDDIVSKGIV